MTGNATQDEQIRESVDDRHGAELSIDPNGETFARELVDDVQHPILAPVVGSILHEIVGPDMVRTLGPKTDA